MSTNAVDMDIGAIADPQLRRRIAVAFDRLRARAEYGLVFEKHIPESVVLHGQSIREDRYATLRVNAGPRNAFRVLEIEDDKATLQPVDEHFHPTGDATSEELDALVPIAPFGDPMFPGLVETGQVLGAADAEGRPTKPFHSVINGENFHALETLLYAMRERSTASTSIPLTTAGPRTGSTTTTTSTRTTSTATHYGCPSWRNG